MNSHSYSDWGVSETGDVEKDQTTKTDSKIVNDGKPYTNSGLTLFVRKRAGTTRFLKARKGLLIFLEGPYPTTLHRTTLQSDRLLLIGGGVGITGLLPYLGHHPNVKIFHSFKAVDSSLMDALGNVLSDTREKEIHLGQRLDLSGLLQHEASLGWLKIAVVVCGPASLCDDVRTIVARLGKEKRGVCSFELEVDAFSW